MFPSSSNETLRRTSIDDNNDELWSEIVHNAEKEKIFSHNTKRNDKFGIAAKFINKCTTSFYCLNDNISKVDFYSTSISTSRRNDDNRVWWSLTPSCDVCLRYFDNNKNLFKYFHKIDIYLLHSTRPYFTVISKCNLIILMMMIIENEIKKIKKINKIKYLYTSIAFEPAKLVNSNNVITQFYSSILIYRIRPLYLDRLRRPLFNQDRLRMENKLNFEIYLFKKFSTLSFFIKQKTHLLGCLISVSLTNLIYLLNLKKLKNLKISKNLKNNEIAKFRMTSITCTVLAASRVFLMNLYIRLCFNFLGIYLLNKSTKQAKSHKCTDLNETERSVPKRLRSVSSINKNFLFLNFKYVYNQFINLFCLLFLNRLYYNCIIDFYNHNLSIFLFKRPKSKCLPIMYQNDHQLMKFMKFMKFNDKTNNQLNSLKDNNFKDKSIFVSLNKVNDNLSNSNLLIAQPAVCVLSNEQTTAQKPIKLCPPLTESPNFKECNQPNNFNENEFRQIENYNQSKGVNQLNKKTALNYNDDFRWKRNKLQNKFSYWFSVLIILLSLTCSVR